MGGIISLYEITLTMKKRRTYSTTHLSLAPVCYLLWQIGKGEPDHLKGPFMKKDGRLHVIPMKAWFNMADWIGLSLSLEWHAPTIPSVESWTVYPWHPGQHSRIYGITPKSLNIDISSSIPLTSILIKLSPEEWKSIFSSFANPAASDGECARYRGSV